MDFSVILIFLVASKEGLFQTEIFGNFFGLFFCLLLRLAVRISLPFHISLTLNLTLTLTLKQHSFFKKLKVDPDPTRRFTDTPF